MTETLEITYENVMDYYMGEIFSNDLAHNLNHVIDVYFRMLNMNRLLNIGVSYKLIVLSAFLHDLKCHVDRSKHEILSANYITDCFNNEDCEDPFIKQLTEDEVDVLKNAILKHRASGDDVPESGLAGLLYAADKDIPDLKDIIIRAGEYDSDPEHILKHIQEKFSEDGYIKYNHYYECYYGLFNIDKLYNNISRLTLDDVKNIISH